MTLDVTKPTDQTQVQAIAEYIRENRIAINALIAGDPGDSEITLTTLSVPAGTISLTVGTDLTDIAVEILLISGNGLSTLTSILKGTAGQIKLFIFQNNGIDLVDGVKNSGKFYLNQLPALTTFSPDIDDILVLINIGGDGLTEYGYWKEIFRNISIK